MSNADPALAPIKEEAASDPSPVTSTPSDPDIRSFSQLLAGAMEPQAASPRGVPVRPVPVVPLSVVPVPCLFSPATLLDSPGFTGQFAMTHQAVLATVTAQAQMQLQAAYPSSSEALTKSLLPSAPISPVPLQQRPASASEGNVSTPDSAQSPPCDPKFQSTQILVKTSSNDRYNWRKYGQKQVKSKDRSRSYYKCTNVNCFAKKNVERCLDGRETEIVYRGQHNHDPPQRTRCPKERGVQSGGPYGENETFDLISSKLPQKTRCPKERVSQSGGPSSENETPLTGELPSGEVDDSDPSTSKPEQNSGNETPEPRLYCSSDCEGDAAMKTEEEHDYEPDPKRRLNESTTPCSAPPVLKTFKEPKIIVQSASDAARVTDGYKWRKYGQKFVKGNPNPRSYYRCTHNGCPVRKHVEKASDDSNSLLITYEGKHNHDQPPLKSSGSDQPASAFPIAAASLTETYQSHNSDSSADKKTLADGKALEVGSETALASAQTLLSIGSNSSSPGEEASGINSDGMNRPLFSENRAAVPVQNS